MHDEAVRASLATAAGMKRLDCHGFSVRGVAGTLVTWYSPFQHARWQQVEVGAANGTRDDADQDAVALGLRTIRE